MERPSALSWRLHCCQLGVHVNGGVDGTPILSCSYVIDVRARGNPQGRVDAGLSMYFVDYRSVLPASGSPDSKNASGTSMSDAPESTSPRFLSTHSVSKSQYPLCSEHTLRACPSLVGRKQPPIQYVWCKFHRSKPTSSHAGETSLGRHGETYSG